MTTVDAESTTEGLRVVVVDTRPERRELVRHLIASTGVAAAAIAEAATASEAVGMLDEEDRDVAVVEIQMPVSEGLKTIAALRGRSSGLRILVCSFCCDPVTKAQAHAEGADAFLDKPVAPEALRNVLQGFFPPRGAAEPAAKKVRKAKPRPSSAPRRRAKPE